jgi:hypothetical protein
VQPRAQKDTAMLDDDDDGFFTIKGFGDWGQVARTYTYQLIGKGEIEAVKAGAKTLITKSSARRWRDALPRIKPSAKSTEAA